MAVPVAIVVGCTIVAAGLFFGLRAREPVVAPPVSAPPLSAPPVAAPPTPAPAPVGVARELVAAQAGEAIAYHRGLLRERCPVPAGATGHVTLDITFDADGVQRARGVIDDRDNPPGFAICVGDALPALLVPPPGATTRLELELRLP